MAKSAKRKKEIEYKRRLKELKRKLNPYRDYETMRLLRVITGKSRMNLHGHWESLESVLTGEYSHQVVKKRIQSVVNEILKNGEHTKCRDSYHDPSLDMVDKTLAYLNVNLKAESDYDFKIDSKANVLDNVGPCNIDSKANVLGNVGLCNIDSKASVFETADSTD